MMRVSENAAPGSPWPPKGRAKRRRAAAPAEPVQTAPAKTSSLLNLQAHQQELEQQNEELRQSAMNFRTFFDVIGDMIVVADQSGKIIFTNQALVRKLGFSAEELRSMHVLDLHPPEVRHEAGLIFDAMLRGEATMCPLPLATQRGALVPVETRVWRGQWSGAPCLFGLCKDLSVEQEDQQRFERLFRYSPALMALSLLPEQVFVDVNEAFLKTLGFSKQEVIGRTVAQLRLFPVPEQQSLAAKLLLEEGRIADFDLQVRCKNGTVLDGLFSGEVITNQGRQYFLTVMLDVTARKQVEAAETIRRLNAELEKRVVERTATIRKLHAELTVAEQRERTRLSLILHENLQQLMIGARFLLQTALKELGEKDRSRISRIDQILSESVRVTRNLAIELSPPILRDEGLVATLQWLGQWMLENYGLAVAVKVGPVRTALSEELSVLIYQAVRELLINTIKHAHVNAAELSMEQSGERLMIVVSDKGTGFVPDALRDGAAAAPSLGLASVRERLAILGGQLDIESAPGKGASIRLCVPLSPPEDRFGGD